MVMKKLLLFTILGLLTTPLVFCQLYAGASTGMIREKLGGQFFIGYSFNQKWQAGIDINSLLIQPPTWFGVQGGPVIRLDDKDEKYTYVIPYGGLYYKKVGRTSSMDRYVKNGIITVLSSDLETDEMNYGLGVTVTRQMFYIKLASFFNKRESAYGLTVGMSHLFR